MSLISSCDRPKSASGSLNGLSSAIVTRSVRWEWAWAGCPLETVWEQYEHRPPFLHIGLHKSLKSCI